MLNEFHDPIASSHSSGAIKLSIDIPPEKLLLLDKLDQIHAQLGSSIANSRNNYISAYLSSHHFDRALDPMWREKTCDRLRHLLYCQNRKGYTNDFVRQTFRKPDGMSKTEFDRLQDDIINSFNFITAFGHGDQNGTALNTYNTHLRAKRQTISCVYTGLSNEDFLDVLTGYENALFRLIQSPLKTTDEPA